MKRFNLFFGVALLAGIGLSFVGAANNFVREETRVLEADFILPGACDGLQETIVNELVGDVENVLREADPHVFMTKCYSRVVFKPIKEDEDFMFMHSNELRGDLIFINCGQRVRLADVRINCESKEVRLRESMRGASKSKGEFIKDFAEYIKTNGLPKDQF